MPFSWVTIAQFSHLFGPHETQRASTEAQATSVVLEKLCLGNRHKQGKLEVSLLTQPQVLAGRWAASAQVAPGFTLLWLPAPNGASKQSNKPQHLPWQFSSQCLGTLWTRNRPGEGRHWPDLPHSSSQKGTAPKRTNQCFGNPSPLGDTSAHIQQIENLCVVLPAWAQPFTPTVIQTTRAEARWWMK